MSENLNARTIELNWHELNDEVLTLKSGQRFWFSDHYAHYSRILSESGIKTRYVDADERPGDTSHNGNGWTEKVREYRVQDDATPGEIAELNRLRLDHLTRSFTEPKFTGSPEWNDLSQEIKARLYAVCTVPRVQAWRTEIPGYIGPVLLDEPYGPYTHPAEQPTQQDEVDWETL